MRKQNCRQRPNSSKEFNPPERRRCNSQIYHSPRANDTEGKHFPKLLKDFANFLREWYIHNLFCSGAPLYIDAE